MSCRRIRKSNNLLAEEAEDERERERERERSVEVRGKKSLKGLLTVGILCWRR
jgi:hypothetical protein